MTDFRKWFVVAVVLLATAAMLNAAAYQCTFNAGVPTRVRGEGRAELMGDLVLNCAGDPVPAGTMANIQVFLSTNITSRIIDPSTLKTEALMFLNEPGPTQQMIGYNSFQGMKASDNSLLWINVPLFVPVPPATTPLSQLVTTIRITNIRANAAQAGISAALIPTQVSAFITVTGSTAIPINNPTQVVAAVLKGLDFAIRNCKDTEAVDVISSTYVFFQCSSPSGSTSATSLHHELAGLLKFSEMYDTAWKTAIYTSAPVLSSVFPNSEAGYVNIPVFGLSVGTPSSGTRLIARFANIPDGVSIFVTTTEIPTAKVPTATTSGTTGRLITVTDPTGTSGSLTMPVPATGGLRILGYDAETTSTNCLGITDAAAAFVVAQVPIVSGAGSATWELASVAGSIMENISFGYEVSFSARPDLTSPALSTVFGTVSGNFAPISSDDKMSAYSPIPRFADMAISKNVVNIYECVTNLLFPFVTARAGFDTGIAISNTTLDNSVNMPGGTADFPLSSRPHGGKCYLFFFGDKEDGTSLAKPVQTSGVVAAGKQLVFTIFGGGAGIDAAPGFQGYIIANCKFRLAHGFAFISDLGAQKLAMGYLSLVITTTYGNPPRRGISSVETLDN